MREYCERIINPHENIYTLTFSFIVTTASGSDSSLSGSRWISNRVKPGTSSYSCHLEIGLKVFVASTSYPVGEEDWECDRLLMD